MPEVSVIVPAYNVERYVGACLGSLADQTFPDFEVLCIDDCSDDGTLEAARAAAETDERISVHAAERNRGLSATRNFGIEAARGRYLVFLDADDLLVPEALEKLVNRAGQQDLDDLFFSATTFYDSDEAHARHEEVFAPRPDLAEAMAGKDLFEWFIGCGGLWPQAPYHMVRREFIERAGIRFVEGILHEDELYTVQTLCAAERAGYLNEELYLRRVREDSIMTTSRGMRNVAGVFRVLRELRAWIGEHEGECSDSFVDAYAFNMACLQATMVRDASGVGSDELDAFAAGLTGAERLDFALAVREGVRAEHALAQEVVDSKTYRAGDALLRVPRSLRDALASRRRTARKEGS